MKTASVDVVRGPWPGTVASQGFVANVVQLPELRHLIAACGMRDRALVWIAERQLGLIATWQLRAIGFSESAIARRVTRGALHRVFRGVFLVGHPIPVPGARELAAVLVCRSAAVVSHRSAAALWGLVNDASSVVEVTTVGRHLRSRGDLAVHRSDHLDPRDRALKNGIPVTAPARTLIDFAAAAKRDELEWALAQAQVRRLVTDQKLTDALALAGKRAGAGIVRAALSREGGPRLTRSEAERRLLRIIRAAGLPEPETNARVAGFEVDFLWPEQGLIVEVDGFAFHGHRTAFERDRRRDMALRSAGFEVIRVTWRQLVEEPLRVIAHIARELYNSSASRPK